MVNLWAHLLQSYEVSGRFYFTKRGVKFYEKKQSHEPGSILPSNAGRSAGSCRRVAEVHANTVEMRIKRLTCPAPQKLQLLDAIIADARLKRLAKTKEATYDKDTVPERYD